MRGLLALPLLVLVQGASAETFETDVRNVFETVSVEEPSAPPSGLPDKVDLSYQFDPVYRSQGKMQTCHAFSATALFEAAAYRESGAHIRLSEADVFVNSRTNKRVKRQHGQLRDDLWAALDNGVALGDFYEGFVERWKGGERRRDKLCPECEGAPRAYFPKLRVEGPDFLRFFGSTVRTAIKNGPVKCVGRSSRRDLIMKTLASGLPVGAGVLLDGMSDPALAQDGGAWGGPHYIVITGYEKTQAGVVFSARNSWTRSASPTLTESDMCGLFGLSWLTP